MRELSHVDETGRAKMVDVGGKPEQRRRARAMGRIALSPAAREALQGNLLKKGDALMVAQLAGIQAAKRTAVLIPLCHPLALDHVEVQLRLTEEGVEATAEARCVGRTGVEMEALCAVSVALLTVYDMCKSVDREMRIEEVKLVEKAKENV